MRRLGWLALLLAVLPARSAQETRGNISGTVRTVAVSFPARRCRSGTSTRVRRSTWSPTAPAISRRRCSIPAPTTFDVEMNGLQGDATRTSCSASASS